MTGQIGVDMTDTPTAVEDDVDWNPRDLNEGDTIWVYEYYRGHFAR